MKKLFLTLTLVLFIIPIGISQDLPSYVPSEGLEAYYTFKGNANDSSGNGNNGILSGATLTADKEGNTNSAYSFDGVSNTIGFESPFFNGEQISSFTLFARFKVFNLENSPNIWGKSFFWGEVNFELLSNNSVKLMWANSVSGNRYSRVTTLENSISDDEWTDILITYENRQLKVFKNGSLINSTMSYTQQGGGFLSDSQVEVSCNFAQDANSNKIGRRLTGGSPGRYFEGIIDDFGIWNRALTEQEIQNLYTSSTGDIILNGVVSAENNQIKNVADPTESQDAVTLGLLLEKISSLQDQIDVLQSTSCSETVTDQDGNSYGVVELCGKLWTTSNAKTTTYRNGDQINPLTYNPWGCEDGFLESDYGSYDIPCNENFTDHYISTFGYLYDYAMLNDDRLIAPEGWRVPTMEDYQCLIELYPTSAYSLSESDDELTSNLKSTLEVSNYHISYYEDSPHYNNTVVENLRNSGIIWYGNEADPHRDIINNGAWYTSQSINDQLVKMVGTNKSGFDAKPGGFIHPEVAPLGAKIGKQAYFMTKSQNGSRQNEGVVLSITGIEANSLANLSSSLKNGTYGSLRFVKDID